MSRVIARLRRRYSYGDSKIIGDDNVKCDNEAISDDNIKRDSNRGDKRLQLKGPVHQWHPFGLLPFPYIITRNSKSSNKIKYIDVSEDREKMEVTRLE